jgi:Ca-activated chloride channel family protein
VLLSDGTNTVGREPAEAARAALEAGIPVSTIAYGTQEGVVQVQGELIPVPVDRPALERLAEATGGTAFTAESGEELSGVYEDIGSQVGTTTERREVTASVTGIALALGIGAAVASLVWGARLP